MGGRREGERCVRGLLLMVRILLLLLLLLEVEVRVVRLEECV